MAIATREIVKTEPISGLARLDKIQTRIRKADEIIAGLLPLDLQSTGPGNKYETSALAKVLNVSMTEARRISVLTTNADRMVVPQTSK